MSRVFTAEAFGLLSVFTSFSVFFAVVSTGRYELAIGLPDNVSKAVKIFKLILLLALTISLFYLMVIFLLREVFQVNDKTMFLANKDVYLAPIYIFFGAFYSALMYWNQRFKNYKKITVGNALQVIVTTVFSLIFGFMGFMSGMIWSLVIGIAFSSFFLFFTDKKLLALMKYGNNIFPTALEYKSFPRYMTLSDLSLTASQQFIPVLFSVLYSTTIVGLFAMANRMIRLPSIVITQSIGNVFRNDAIDEIRRKGNCAELYKATFKKLLAISVPIYLVLFLVSPLLFKLVFGDEWEMAGHFARILSTMLLFEFIATPLNTLFYIREKQKVLMRLQVLNAISGAIMIFLGFFLFKSASYSLVFFCINAIAFNLLFMFMTYRISNS